MNSVEFANSSLSHYVQPGNNGPFLRFPPPLLHHFGARQQTAVPLLREDVAEHCAAVSEKAEKFKFYSEANGYFAIPSNAKTQKNKLAKKSTLFCEKCSRPQEAEKTKVTDLRGLYPPAVYVHLRGLCSFRAPAGGSRASDAFEASELFWDIFCIQNNSVCAADSGKFEIQQLSWEARNRGMQPRHSAALFATCKLLNKSCTKRPVRQLLSTKSLQASSPANFQVKSC